jgi:putative flippase GtrA
VTCRLLHPPLLARHGEIVEHATWYVVAGVSTTLLQGLLFLLLRDPVGSLPANMAATVVTTLVNTEFHRRVTFANSSSSPFRRHLQSALTLLFYATYGSVVLLALRALVGTPSATMEAAALMAGSTVGGIGRFVLLRWWVFTGLAKVSSGDRVT